LTTPWHIAILIPARDEEQLLPRCLRSIHRARQTLPPFVTSDLIVVSDLSTDDTYSIAKTLIQHNGLNGLDKLNGLNGLNGLVTHSSAGCVGSARALAATVALSRYSGQTDRCWFANTDADCEVPSHWLLQHLSIADAGFAAAAGIIDVDSFSEHDAVVAERFRLTYKIHSDGTHPHIHGANLGVRADAYLTAGGWQNLAVAEDHDLWKRLADHQFKRVSDASLCVITSGRRTGRAPDGFATALAAHNGGA
jgi:glycosyltransferase involved in cell wall biosynthesis